ncbi:uracil-DNA glycosylase [Glaciimonas sp. GG7]
MNISTRRTAFLDECGVGPLWVRRQVATHQPTMSLELIEGSLAVDPVLSTIALAVPAMSAPIPAIIYVPAVGEVTYAWEDTASTLPASTPAAIVQTDTASMDWRQLKAAVAACTQCGLCHGRTHTVFGVGDERAKWLFIGEGPGLAEDQQGEPFVGPAGKLLDNMLAAMGVKRGESAYITNIVKCRSTDDDGNDRSPSAEEIAACLPYLQRQIALIAPTVLVALGKTAALSLLALDPTTAVSTLRGTVHRYAGLPLVVTYHPAYLLRKPSEKAKVWDDLCLAMRCYASAVA